MLTVRHGDPETSRMRASQLDNLTFSSPTLGEAYPSDTAINKTTVGRHVTKPTSARASQPDNSSFPSARTTIRTPPNATHSTIKQP